MKSKIISALFFGCALVTAGDAAATTIQGYGCVDVSRDFESPYCWQAPLNFSDVPAPGTADMIAITNNSTDKYGGEQTINVGMWNTTANGSGTLFESGTLTYGESENFTVSPSGSYVGAIFLACVDPNQPAYVNGVGSCQ
jgi:hypothetical protein